ncbi:hypothetical protein CK203_079397 [Vitis vinifera]|uniref:Apple domain-containing protein n=1 Tax=Vitis vinifera TaxID=29760 RepID=A0A438BSM6_VITVI|nr:hypothetical protein CK203_079397 [Vitis vinifera]
MVRLLYSPKGPVDRYSRCGPNSNCDNRHTEFECTCLAGWGGAKPPDTSVARVNMNMSLEACREECLKECSCSGYAAANVSGSGRFMNDFSLRFMRSFKRFPSEEGDDGSFGGGGCCDYGSIALLILVKEEDGR